MGYVNGKWEQRMRDAGAGTDEGLWVKAAQGIGSKEIDGWHEVKLAVDWINNYHAAKRPKPAPAPAPVAAPSSAAPEEAYKTIPGVDSYTPQRYLTSNMKDNNQSSDDDSYDPTSIFNYGYGNDQGYYPNRYENEQGLIDREGSIEDAGSLLNDWIFKIKNDEKLNASTRIDNIANEDFNYGKDNRSTSRYHTSNYY